MSQCNVLCYYVSICYNNIIVIVCEWREGGREREREREN